MSDSSHGAKRFPGSSSRPVHHTTFLVTAEPGSTAWMDRPSGDEPGLRVRPLLGCEALKAQGQAPCGHMASLLTANPWAWKCRVRWGHRQSHPTEEADRRSTVAAGAWRPPVCWVPKACLHPPGGARWSLVAGCAFLW